MRGAIRRALRCTQRSTQRSPQSSHMSACNEGGSRDAMREGHQHAMREGHQHAMREAVGMQSWLPRPPDNRSARAPDEGCNQAGHERQSMANEGDNRSSAGAVSSTSASTCSKSGRVLPARKCSRRRRAAPTAACTRASRAVGASTVTTTAPSPPQASVNAMIAASPWAIAACTRATRSRGEEGLRRCNLGAISHLLALEAISADVPGGERRRNVPQPEGRAAHHGAADRLHRLVEGGKHLMRGAIRQAISGNQWQSMAINGRRRQAPFRAPLKAPHLMRGVIRRPQVGGEGGG
jgi:hypothetical protein